MDGSLMDPDNEKNKIQELKLLTSGDETLSQFSLNDDTYLERFLKSTSYDLQEAFNKLKSLYALLLEYPDAFPIQYPTASKHVLEQHCRIGLQETDREGRPIYILKLGNLNPSKVTFLEVLIVDDMWMEWFIMNSASEKGICMLIDVASLPLKCLKWLTPNNVTFIIKKIQYLPFKDCRFHVVNNSMLFHAVYKLIWPFMSEQIKKQVMFHFNDRPSLHKHVDPNSLPEEYGGNQGILDYKKIYNQVYQQNDVIFESFKRNRTRRSVF